MKKKSVLIGLLLLLAGGWVLTSCTKNDENTIVPIGTEYYIDDILSVIPDSLQTQFMAAFGVMPQGAIPPKINGEYVVDPKQRVGSNVTEWPLSVVEPNVYLRFIKQHNELVVMELSEATEQLTDTVFVMGHDSDFTAYLIEDKTYDVELDANTYHVKMKRGIVIGGRVTETGIANLRMASIIMEASDDSQGVLSQYAPGSYFIYKDGDGLAANLDW